MRRYRGILFVDSETLTRMGGGQGALLEADVADDQLKLVWAGGQRTAIELKRIREQAELHPGLPSPTIAFVSARGEAGPRSSAERSAQDVKALGAVGLMFESTTPLCGLQFVEPHSLVFSIGWLTAQGLRREGDPAQIS